MMQSINMFTAENPPRSEYMTLLFFKKNIYRLSEGDHPFEARVTIPRLMIRAKYTSSGVLLIIPASGSGDFDAILDGVTADIKGQISTNEQVTGTHLHVDNLAMELIVKKTRMHIAKVFKNSRILSKFEIIVLYYSNCHLPMSLQPKPQICSSVRMGMKYLERCNHNCRKNSPSNSPESQINY